MLFRSEGAALGSRKVVGLGSIVRTIPVIAAQTLRLAACKITLPNSTASHTRSNEHRSSLVVGLWLMAVLAAIRASLSHPVHTTVTLSLFTESNFATSFICFEFDFRCFPRAFFD